MNEIRDAFVASAKRAARLRIDRYQHERDDDRQRRACPGQNLCDDPN